MNASIPWFTLALIIGGECDTVSAQTIKDVVESSWHGMALQDASFTQSGKAYIDQWLKLTMEDDRSVHGTSTSVFTLDGVPYTREVRVSGRYDETEQAVYIEESSSATRSDELPNGLGWCRGWGTLYFYMDDGRPGHYLLKGTMDDDCNSSTFVEYADP